MKKLLPSAAVMLSLGLMATFGNAYGQAEIKTAAAKPGAAKGSEVEVTVKEYTIEMATSVSSGLTTFKVTNTGKETHGFEIEGNGIEKEIKPTLKQGKSGSLQVDLKPGTYKVYCPVKGHKMLGMSLNLIVK